MSTTNPSTLTIPLIEEAIQQMLEQAGERHLATKSTNSTLALLTMGFQLRNLVHASDLTCALAAYGVVRYLQDQKAKQANKREMQVTE